MVRMTSCRMVPSRFFLVVAHEGTAVAGQNSCTGSSHSGTVEGRESAASHGLSRLLRPRSCSFLCESAMKLW